MSKTKGPLFLDISFMPLITTKAFHLQLAKDALLHKQFPVAVKCIAYNSPVDSFSAISLISCSIKAVEYPQIFRRFLNTFTCIQ
jgi:hypothetical protein